MPPVDQNRLAAARANLASHANTLADSVRRLKEQADLLLAASADFTTLEIDQPTSLVRPDAPGSRPYPADPRGPFNQEPAPGSRPYPGGPFGMPEATTQQADERRGPFGIFPGKPGASADGTEVPKTATEIVDKNGCKWTLGLPFAGDPTADRPVLLDGKPVYGGSGVATSLVAKGGMVWARNRRGEWMTDSGSNWVPSASAPF